MVANAQALQVVVTSGPDDVARATFAFQTALAAVASGLEVRVFLVLDAGKWVCEPRMHSSRAVYELIDQLENLGAKITYCSTCVVEQCAPEQWASSHPAATADGAAALVNPTMQASGLADFLEGVVKGTPTVTI